MSFPAQSDRHGTSAGIERGQPEKKKRKPRYSGEAETTDLDRMEQSCANIDTLKKEEDGVLEDLSELNALETQVETLRANIGGLKRLRALPINYGKRVQRIPFSKLTWSNLESRLGISTSTIKTDSADGFLDKLIDQLQEENVDPIVTSILDIIEGYNNLAGIVKLFVLIELVVHSGPEMTARMKVDQWLLEAAKLCLVKPLDHATLIFPELKISSLDYDLEVRIEHGKFISYLTGSTDYVVWTHPSDGLSFGQEDLMSDVQNVSSSMGLISPEAVTSIYEAKRNQEHLEDHLPQVIGESLALCHILTNSTDVAVKKMSFCLSNGDQWLFGVLDSDSRICTKTNVFKIDVKVVSDVKQILTLVMFWATCRGDVLQRAMQKML